MKRKRLIRRSLLLRIARPNKSDQCTTEAGNRAVTHCEAVNNTPDKVGSVRDVEVLVAQEIIHLQVVVLALILGVADLGYINNTKEEEEEHQSGEQKRNSKKKIGMLHSDV